MSVECSGIIFFYSSQMSVLPYMTREAGVCVCVCDLSALVLWWRCKLSGLDCGHCVQWWRCHGNTVSNEPCESGWRCFSVFCCSPVTAVSLNSLDFPLGQLIKQVIVLIFLEFMLFVHLNYWARLFSICLFEEPYKANSRYQNTYSMFNVVMVFLGKIYFL